MKTLFLLTLLLFWPSLALSQVVAIQQPRSAMPASAKATVTRTSGGSIQTVLAGNYALNKESSLTREWITVHDPNLPVKFNGTFGVTTAYFPSRSLGEYRYVAKTTIEALEPIAAIEIRFLTFDLWGNHIRTLQQTRIADISSVKELGAEWNLYSENEASEYYASIAYIAKVRTQKGRVLEGDIATVIDEARKLSKKFTPELLEPKVDKK